MPPPTLASKPTARPARSAAQKDRPGVLGQHRLVGADHVLAGCERLEQQRARGLMTAEQLDYDVDIGARDQRGRIGRDQRRSQSDRRVGRDDFVGYAREFERRAQLVRQHLAVLAHQLEHSGADFATAEQTDSDGF